MTISYGRREYSPSGTMYTQRVLMTEEEWAIFAGNLQMEISNGYPNRAVYGRNNPDIYVAAYLQMPKVYRVYANSPQSTAYLNLTQTCFLKLLLGSSEIGNRLKTNQNTYIEINHIGIR